MTTRLHRSGGASGRAAGPRLARNARTALLFAAAALSASCAASPKYRARAGETPVATATPQAETASIVTLPFAIAPPVRGFRCDRIRSRFGPRGNAAKMHEGIDIEAEPGEAVLAAAEGTVRFAGRRRSYGTAVVIDHADGVSTLYGHCAYLKVRQGRRVSAGERIGTAGKRGRASSVHLHFELRIAGRAVDPQPHLCLDSGPDSR